MFESYNFLSFCFHSEVFVVVICNVPTVQFDNVALGNVLFAVTTVLVEVAIFT